MQLELVTGVLLDFDGAPVCFSWRDRSYTVCSRPVRWYSRRMWWQEASGAPKGVGAELVEIEMWRLWAVSDTDRIFFELTHKMPEDQWEIARGD